MAIIHDFNLPVSLTELPDSFTYPFNYTPHKLCRLAAEQLKKIIREYIKHSSEIAKELQRGKMFGVLVVQHSDSVSFLAAFSGNLAHKNVYPDFVPPVYDMLNPEGFFLSGEAELNRINRRVAELEASDELMNLRDELQHYEELLVSTKQEHKKFLGEAKRLRDERRLLAGDDLELIAELNRESSFLKAECRRKEGALRDNILTIESKLRTLYTEIKELKVQRREFSATLQQQIFEHFVVLNGRGESRNLMEIFADTPQGIPPAGAGECAAPKLLQYAYANGLKPICMAEFWWGDSPKDEVRRDGEFYPSCKSKCEPILNYMMQGLTVEMNPILFQGKDLWPGVVYEDEWILAIDKRSGMLSMRGKVDVPSVDEWLKVEYPGSDYYVVHRLDMDTSGILLIAKTLEVYKALQGLFAKKQVEKRYIALISGVPKVSEGIINIPLIADIDNRPFQKVDYINGKESITEYKVLNSKNGVSRIQFRPLTGRTHQLRVHAAHLDGLNAPIIGDNLYGRRGRRLMLHAESVQFIHPITKTRVVISSPVPF